MGYLRTVFALIACKEASLFGVNSCSCTSASTFYKLREIERLGFAFGVLGPVLASWFGVAPLKGTPIATGWVPQRMLAGLLINGCWGMGMVLIYAGLRRWVSGPRQPQAV